MRTAVRRLEAGRPRIAVRLPRSVVHADSGARPAEELVVVDQDVERVLDPDRLGELEVLAGAERGALQAQAAHAHVVARDGEHVERAHGRDGPQQRSFAEPAPATHQVYAGRDLDAAAVATLGAGQVDRRVVRHVDDLLRGRHLRRVRRRQRSDWIRDQGGGDDRGRGERRQIGELAQEPRSIVHDDRVRAGNARRARAHLAAGRARVVPCHDAQAVGRVLRQADELVGARDPVGDRTSTLEHVPALGPVLPSLDPIAELDTRMVEPLDRDRACGLERYRHGGRQGRRLLGHGHGHHGG
jgi:hypothetical protein